MAITGIPNYSDRPIQSLRCPCGVRYIILIGPEDQSQAARAEAERIGADFVDARQLLAIECYCGAWLDVSRDSSVSVQ